MTPVRVLVSRLLGMFGRPRRERDLHDEVETHLQLLTDEHLRRGFSTADAQAAGRRAFGGVEQMKECYRDQRGWPWLEDLIRDTWYGGRLLWRRPGFTIAAVFALALGIGANTVVFTIVNAILLRNLPFDHPEQIVSIGTRDPHGRDVGVSWLDFEDYRAASHSFSNVGMANQGNLNISDEDHPTNNYFGSFISSDAFAIIGVRPVLGRTLTREDDRIGAPAVLILSGSVWRVRYGSDPSVLGRTVTINGQPATVIGIMPEGMHFPLVAEYWLSTSQLSALTRGRPRDARGFLVFGRLAPGVSIDQARAEMAGIGARLARDFPGTNTDMVPTVTPFVEQAVSPEFKLMVWSLMGAVGLVLLIACANVANLLLVRAAHRSREMSVRVTLGATRGRVVRQLLVESLLLSIISGAVGLGLSLIGIRWFAAVSQNLRLPFWIVFTLDARVFMFCALVCVATGIVFGLAPALHISKTDVNELLKEGGRSGSGGGRARRWTAPLIVTEVTLTLVLLAGAGLMLRSFLNLYRADFGLKTSQLMTMTVRMPNEYATPESRQAFIRGVHERLGTIGAIAAVATASQLPLGGGTSFQLAMDGRATAPGERPPTTTVLSVSPSYFDVLGIRLVRGRAFDEADGTPGHESTIVNQRFVAMYLPGGDPIGRRLQFTDETSTGAQAPWVRIVGVVPTVRQRNVQEREPDPVAYVPHLGDPSVPWYPMLVVRTSDEAGRIMPLIREAISALDPVARVSDVLTMDESLARTRWTSRTFATMLGVFASIALLLSVVGLYAVTAYAVSQRTQEIGLRMALGAQPQQVWWLILRGGLLQLAIGVILGLAGALAAGRLLQNMLVQLEPTDPLTLASIVIVLVTASIIACLWPARRVTQLDPAIALRYE